MPEVMDKKTELLRMLATLDPERLSKDDFGNAFEKVLDVVQQILEKQKKFEAELHGSNSQFKEMVQQEVKKALGDLKAQTNQLFVEGRLKDMSTEQKELFASLKKNVANLFGEKMNEMHREIAKRAIPGPKGDVGIGIGKPPTDLEIQRATAPMFEELKKEVERLKDTRSNRAMGRAKVPGIERVNLSNQLNGQVREFELPRDTTEVLGVWGTSFPINFNPTDGDRADWDLVGNKLVLRDGVPAPEAEQTLWCLVETFFY